EGFVRGCVPIHSLPARDNLKRRDLLRAQRDLPVHRSLCRTRQPLNVADHLATLSDQDLQVVTALDRLLERLRLGRTVLSSHCTEARLRHHRRPPPKKSERGEID